LRRPSNPNKPDPRRTIEVGSGTAVVVSVAENNATIDKLKIIDFFIYNSMNEPNRYSWIFEDCLQ
jgi:hypothetical protein